LFSQSEQAVLINVTSTNGVGFVFTRIGKLWIYNSNFAGVSLSSEVTIQASPGVIARNSYIGGAKIGDSYIGRYMSQTGGIINQVGDPYVFFPGAQVITTPYGQDAYAIPLDMTNFVESEHDKGNSSYYPASVTVFNNTYYGGALSQAVLDALDRGGSWNKDLAGNPRVRGAAIDVGPIEVQE
jgi:hypothetical protein